MDGPAGEPVLDLVLEGGSLTVRAKLNGKNYRKLIKQVDEHGAANLAVALQGVLRPPASPGGPFVLEGAGSQAVVKAPRPPEPSREPPAGGGWGAGGAGGAAGPGGAEARWAVSRPGRVDHPAGSRPAGIRPRDPPEDRKPAGS